MNRAKTWLITALMVSSALSLIGCATLSKQECQLADWQAIGERDGMQGRAMDYLQNHAKACAKINIVPDKALWEQGRQQGLKRYCTSSNAYNIGIAGQSLNLVCPPEQLATLQQANQRGLRVYDTRRQLDHDRTERDKLIEQYKKLRNGSNLDFKTERDARHYMAELPYKIDTLTRRIQQNEAILRELGF